MESVVCPVCGGVMSLSAHALPLMDSADRWAECASCGSEALVDWTLSGRRVVLSYDGVHGGGRSLSSCERPLERLVEDLEREAERSAWCPMPAEEALEEEYVSWPVVANMGLSSSGRPVVVGSVMREGGVVVARDPVGRFLRSCMLWEDWEEVEAWVASVDPAWSAGFPVGSLICHSVGRDGSGVVMEEKSVESVVESSERWACPVCSDPWGGEFAGEEVVLEFDVESGSWHCPRCSRWSASPEDDGAWRVSE